MRQAHAHQVHLMHYCMFRSLTWLLSLDKAYLRAEYFAGWGVTFLEINPHFTHYTLPAPQILPISNNVSTMLW